MNELSRYGASARPGLLASREALRQPIPLAKCSKTTLLPNQSTHTILAMAELIAFKGLSDPAITDS